jgi:phospholipid/cholesterol/gamma-HCH transport system substrate-binding protein
MVASARELLENLVNLTAPGSHVESALANVDAVTGRMSGRYGLLGSALGGDEEAKRLLQTLQRVNDLIANADKRVFGKHGVMDDTQDAIRQLNGVLQDARATLQKVDAVLVEAQGAAANARTATTDLGQLRGEVEASLRKVNRLVDQLNRKWPFARGPEEIKLP